MRDPRVRISNLTAKVVSVFHKSDVNKSEMRSILGQNVNVGEKWRLRMRYLFCLTLPDETPASSNDDKILFSA